MAVSLSRPDPTSPSSVSEAGFSTSRRGYNTDEVRAFLMSVATEMRRLDDQNKQLLSDLTIARERARRPVQIDDSMVAEYLGEETTRVLQTARDSASSIKVRAEERANAVLKEASTNAAELRRRSEVEASNRRKEADTEAQAIIDEAKAEGRAMVAEARAYRERVLADLDRRTTLARQQLDELEHARERLLQVFERARLVAIDVSNELESNRPPSDLVDLSPVTGPVPLIVPASSRPIPNTSTSSRSTDPAGPSTRPSPAPSTDTTTTTTTTTADDTGDDGATPAASTNTGTAGGRSSSGVTVTTGTSASNGASTTGTGTGRSATEPSMTTDAITRSAIEAGRSGADGAAAKSASPTDTASGEPSASPRSTSGSDRENVVALFPQHTSVSADDASDTDVDADDDVAGDDEVDVVDEASSPISSTDTGPDADASQNDDAETSGVETSDADASDADASDSDDPDVSNDDATGDGDTVVAAEDDDEQTQDDDSDESASDGAALVDDDGPVDEDGPVDDDAPVDGAADEVSGEASEDDAAASDPGNPADEDHRVEDLFDRLRKGIAADTAVGEVSDADTEVGATTAMATAANDSAAADAGDTLASDTPADDETSEDATVTPFSQRDHIIAPMISAVGRGIKRQFGDEQNAGLHRLRENDPVEATADLVPEQGDHLRIYVDVIRDTLVDAAVAGAVARGGSDTKKTRTALAASPALDAPTEILNESVIEVLRSRVGDAVSEAAGDNATISKRLRSIYRELKTEIVDEAAANMVRAAYGVGMAFAVTDGTAQLWRVDERYPACPDCEDNSLSEPVAAGGEFPTGHVLAPAHPGCRCIIVPVAD